MHTNRRENWLSFSSVRPGYYGKKSQRHRIASHRIAPATIFTLCEAAESGKGTRMKRGFGKKETTRKRNITRITGKYRKLLWQDRRSMIRIFLILLHPLSPSSDDGCDDDDDMMTWGRTVKTIISLLPR